MSELKAFVDYMRSAGVRRLSFQSGMCFDDHHQPIASLELFDTPTAEELWGPLAGIPTDIPPAPAPESKEPNQCIALGCSETNGWFGDRRYCRAHGLSASGVSK